VPKLFYVACALDEADPRYTDGLKSAQFVNKVAMEEGGVRSLEDMDELLRECVNSRDIDVLMLRSLPREAALV